MTDMPMDIDDLKLAWQGLNRRLERQNALAFQQFKDARVRKVKWRLWPLYSGQLGQVLIGAGIVVVAARTWATHWELVHLRAAGLLMHLYGVLIIIASARTVSLITRIDFAAPVVAIQRQLGELRHWYVRTGTALGLAWWLLWMPAMMVLVSLAGVDIWTRAPGVFSLGTAIGMAGLLLTWALHAWSRRPRWAWLAAMNDAAMTGSSLRHARAVLEEIRQFEDDGGDAPAPPVA